MKDVPVWAFHGDADGTVSPYGSITPIKDLKNCTPKPGTTPKLTMYPGVGHNSWDRTYDNSGMGKESAQYDPFDMSIFDWFLQYSKKNISVNLGGDKSITLPTNSISLNSTANSSNGIKSYSWTKQSGPSATLTNANTATVSVSAMIAGSYVFRLTITDNTNATAYDEIKVTVNPKPNAAPLANAGSDKIIALPVNSIAISGAASDTDGSISTYLWSKSSGPSATLQNTDKATLNVTNMIAGSYVFKLTVTDNAGATASDEMKVTVEGANKAPAANAGSDITIKLPVNSAALQGSASDSDGTIATYSWSKVSGGAANLQHQNTANLSVSGLLVGSYIFRLTVVDNEGASHFDEAKVIVNPADLPALPPAGENSALRSFKLNAANSSVSCGLSGWNDIIFPIPVKTSKSYTLKDSTGQLTDVSLTLWNGMNGSTVIGVADNGSTFKSTICPDNVMRYTAYTTGNCVMEVNGLNPANHYTMEFYIGRSGSGSRKTKITVNGQSQTIESINNKSNTLLFESVKPSNGKITFSFGIDNDTWSYLNGLTIREFDLSSARSASANAEITESLELELSQASFTVYPNPAKDRLFMKGEFSPGSRYSINIFSLAGNLVYRKNLENELDKGIELDIPNGMYILKVQDDQGGHFQKRFVVSK